MFDETTRLLAQGSQKFSVQMEIHADADGYVDKECPHAECQFDFKIHEDDWSAIVRDEEVFCPACGHAAPAKSWFTTEQVEWAQQNAVNQLSHMLGDAMRRDAESFNRRQPHGGFITMSMQVRGRSEPVQLPLAASEPMRLKMRCSQCQCRYSVVGSAYFCPSCGHSAVEQVYDQSLEKIRAALDLAPTLRTSIPDRDTAEHTINVLVEGGLQGAVTAFQRIAEALFAASPSAPKARRNAFQNLEEGSRLWSHLYGNSYETHLARAELDRLARYVQQRHLLAHRDGLVDAEYVAKSGDSSFREGQRLVIKDTHVRDCLGLLEKLVGGLRVDAAAPRNGTP